jgi:hypothetical protein
MIIHIGFVMDKVALGQVISKHFGFILQVIIPLMLHAHVIRTWFCPFAGTVPRDTVSLPLSRLRKDKCMWTELSF